MTNTLSEQVGAQCNAVAAMAVSISQVHADYAALFHSGHGEALLEQVGKRTAELMELLGDILNNMDAVTDDDKWMEPIFDKAQLLWPKELLAANTQATPAHTEPVKHECGCCSGTGRMVRDPDIGTDQECFVCDGSGKVDGDPAPLSQQAAKPEAAQSDMARDAERLNWLETMVVNVRAPMFYGSRNLFWATPENDDPTYPAGPSDIRAQIDAAMQKGAGHVE